MGIRKNLKDLSTTEKKNFVEALWELKKDSVYDDFVSTHQDAMMMPTPSEGEIPNSGIRNAAHRGPSFLPWHREYLRRFELELQKINSEVTLPYWNWQEDSKLADPKDGRIWTNDFMGGNGDQNDNWILKDGPFGVLENKWPVTFNGPSLRRRLGIRVNQSNQDIRVPFPKESEVLQALSELSYDEAPWNRQSGGFRNRLEGWMNGPALHNLIHVWVSGSWMKDTPQGKRIVRGSMSPGTSPNDPVFFLHHCFIDKIWSDWQRKQREMNSEGFPFYLPKNGGPPGHNLNDPMFPCGGDSTPSSVLDHRDLGYTYDTDDEEMADLLTVARINLDESPYIV